MSPHSVSAFGAPLSGSEFLEPTNAAATKAGPCTLPFVRLEVKKKGDLHRRVKEQSGVNLF
jgi:hypothetical protein